LYRDGDSRGKLSGSSRKLSGSRRKLREVEWIDCGSRGKLSGSCRKLNGSSGKLIGEMIFLLYLDRKQTESSVILDRTLQVLLLRFAMNRGVADFDRRQAKENSLPSKRQQPAK
jgi:hypothetical protein